MAVEKPDFRRQQLFAFALGRYHPPRHLGFTQVERRVLHAQRLEDTLPQEAFKRHTRNDFYDPAKSENAGLTVFPLAPRLERKRLRGKGRHQVGQRARGFRFFVGCFSHSGGVSEQVPQRDSRRLAIRSFESTKFWKYLTIGSSRESLPSSISISTAVAVMGFDMDAIQKIESTRMKDLCSASAQP